MSALNNSSEESRWVKECLDGQAGSFRFIVERYERLIRSMIYRLVDDEHEVEELAQQTFIAAYQALGSFSGQSKLSTWLAQIALNKARDYLRGSTQRFIHQSFDELDGGADSVMEHDQDGGDELISRQQTGDHIQRALSLLKPEARELITFKYILGYDYETVAEIIGCTSGAAKVRSIRARGLLKKHLIKMGITP